MAYLLTKINIYISMCVRVCLCVCVSCELLICSNGHKLPCVSAGQASDHKELVF